MSRYALLVYAYTSSTYKVLKKEKYQGMLITLGLQVFGVVDLEARVDSLSTFNKKKKKG